MAFAKGVRGVRRSVLIGFSSVFGFLVLLVVSSLRIAHQSGGDVIGIDSASADVGPGPGPGTYDDDGPGCPGTDGPGCPY